MLKTYELYQKHQDRIEEIWAKSPLCVRDELRKELYDWLKYTGESDGPITDEGIAKKADAVLHELYVEHSRAMVKAIRYEIYRELIDRRKP